MYRAGGMVGDELPGQLVVEGESLPTVVVVEVKVGLAARLLWGRPYPGTRHSTFSSRAAEKLQNAWKGCPFFQYDTAAAASNGIRRIHISLD